MTAGIETSNAATVEPAVTIADCGLRTAEVGSDVQEEDRISMTGGPPARRSLRVALIDGPPYTPLYEVIPAFVERTGIDVDIAVRLPHAALNDVVIDPDNAAKSSFDLISTHIKYAPCQAQALLPLDHLLSAHEIARFLAAPLDHCRVGGELLQLPRHTDTRLLLYRRDWFEDPVMQRRFAEQNARPLTVPETWDDLLDVAVFFTQPPDRFGFAFTGQPSGLFGTFYELLSMAGGTLFDAAGHPDLATPAARWALGYLRRLHVERRVTPPGSLAWDFDEVTNAFMRGSLAMIADWPGRSVCWMTHPDQPWRICTTLHAIPSGRPGYDGSTLESIPSRSPVPAGTCRPRWTSCAR